MKPTDFVGAVCARAALASRPEAERAIHATLHELGKHLSPAHARILQRALPPAFASSVSDFDPDAQPFSLDTFYRAIALREGRRLGLAVEHAQAVCEVVAQCLDERSRNSVLAAVPEQLRPLLSPRDFPDEPPPVRHHRKPAGRGLSDGRPGSSRPLSESGPFAHQHSIAVEGCPQKPHPATLSTGFPRSSRPLSESS